MAQNSYISYYNIRQLADKNATLNTYFTDVIGNKEDTASNTANTTSIVGLLRYIIANLSDDNDVTNLIGTLDTVAKTGDVDNVTTIMGYIKQLVTQLLETDDNLTSALNDTNELQTDWTTGGRLDLLLNSIKNILDLLPDGGLLTSIAQDNTVAKEATLGTPAVTISDDIAAISDLIGTPTINLSTDITNIQTVVDNIEDLIDGTTATPTTYRREAGKTQIFTKQITNAANAGDVTIATLTDGACLIKSIILSSNDATTSDLTSAAILGGSAKVIEFISAATAIKANIDVSDKQVNFIGAVRLPATSEIIMDLQGTDITAVNLQVTIEYTAVVDGAYLI